MEGIDEEDASVAMEGARHPNRQGDAHKQVDDVGGNESRHTLVLSGSNTVYSVFSEITITSVYRFRKREIWPNSQLFHCQEEAFRVAIEFRGIHALDFGHPGLIFAFVDHSSGVFENVDTLGQVIDKEMARGIAG